MREEDVEDKILDCGIISHKIHKGGNFGCMHGGRWIKCNFGYMCVGRQVTVTPLIFVDDVLLFGRLTSFDRSLDSL